MRHDPDSPATTDVGTGAAPHIPAVATWLSPLGTYPECPLCGSGLAPEHAHFRCTGCGWRDSCCD